MIDIHCHILPGVDDGAKDLAMSLAMAQRAVSEGVTHIVATPHHRNGRYENEREKIVFAVSSLNDELEKANIPMTILPGQETRIHGDMIAAYERGELLTVNDQGRYVFIELPATSVPHYTKQLLYELKLQDLLPIIVHPERNRAFREHPESLYRLVRDGTLTQITAGSVVGRFGKGICTFALQLIEHGLTHFVASDAHNLSSRGFHLRQAYTQIEKRFGYDIVADFQEHAEQLILGQEIYPYEAIRIKKRRFFGLF